ncbi:MAG: dUTP diphosphatase [Candidatus Marinimicrobia bacterium]|nr:dUTP diphosphatase [Candidatus Neomarinimicrobiota bacterium]
MELLIKPFDKECEQYYQNHRHFHDGDAGLDLFVIDEMHIQGNTTAFIHFKIACENLNREPYYLMPRSSISKTPLRMSNSIGLIDAGYRGEIIAAVDNIRQEDYTIQPGQRLFQVVAVDGSPISFRLVNELSETSRGAGGFGSTGI